MSYDEHEDEFIREMMAGLVDCGALVPNGMDYMGDFTYSMNAEIMLDVCPEYYIEVMKSANDAIIVLFNDGMVDFNIHEETNVEIWHLTDRGLEYYDTLESAIANAIELKDLNDEIL